MAGQRMDGDGAFPDDLVGMAGIAYEAAGNPAAVSALRATRRGGTIALEGLSGSDAAAVPPDLFCVANLEVHGVFKANVHAWQHAVNLFAHHRLRLGDADSRVDGPVGDLPVTHLTTIASMNHSDPQLSDTPTCSAAAAPDIPVLIGSK